LGTTTLNFLKNWDFIGVQNKDDVLANKFILLQPLGFAPTYSEGGQGEPERYWRAWNQLVPVPDQDDALFLRLAIEKVSAIVQAMYDAKGITNRSTIDGSRRYLFGYSNGGMMSYRYANSTEFAQGYWAALWVFAGAIGGRRYTGSNDVLNSPRPPGAGPNRTTLSLFAHHGELDVAVPPGLPTDVVTLFKSTAMESDLISKGKLTLANATPITVHYRPLRGAIREYLLRNNAVYTDFPTNDQSPSPAQITTGFADRAGGTTSTRSRWGRTTFPPTSSGNPEVIEYRDPTLGHTNYWDAGSTPYFDASFVWNWLMAHPRVT
jgi:hypothetical protein